MYLRVNLLGPGPRLIKKKKNLPGRGLTKVEKHWTRRWHRCIVSQGEYFEGDHGGIQQ